jgi:hypothetical protein
MDNKKAITILQAVRANTANAFIAKVAIREALDMAIAALEQQERETQEKPFPFVVGQPAEIFFDGKWEKGKIVAGYRFGDGVVTIETEDGRKLWCGQDRTDIYRPYQEDEA